MKAFQAGLWSIWLSGFVLISLSLYATQRLPSRGDRIQVPKLNYRALGNQGNPRITIFSAPSPFNGSAGARQSLAVRSWLALSPKITVVLFSQDPSVVSFADAFGSRVLVEPNIDFTFLGTPFFHSMIARSHSFTSDVFVLIDPETILLRDFVSTLNYAYELDHDWLLVSSSRNISHFPFYLEEDGKHWRSGDGKWVRTQELQEILSQSWQWNRCEGRMLMAWNNGDLPLHTAVLPPFLYGKGIHNNWVINEAMSSEFRFVFDASWTISSFHLNDPEHWSNRIVGDSRVSDIGKRSWEYVGNSHIGKLYGSLFYREANYSSLVKLMKCDGQYIFINTTENIVYPYGYHSAFNLWKKRILHPWRQRRIMACVDGIKLLDRILDCSLKDHMKFSEPLDFAFSLESLLPLIADKNKTIVLAVAGYSYKDMLMSWACRLRRLLIKNFMICALDQETYWFSVLQGLPVFKDPLAPSNISFNNCHFGTECFQRVTKVKSRMVLKILKLGYNVMLSDVDVYWFENPLPLLYSFGSAVLVAQSDEFKKTGPINLPRRLNSGFYFAHSDGSTIAAMEKVVKHAATSGLSEQPSFYDTLCGEGGSNRVGDNRCVDGGANISASTLAEDIVKKDEFQIQKSVSELSSTKKEGSEGEKLTSEGLRPGERFKQIKEQEAIRRQKEEEKRKAEEAAPKGTQPTNEGHEREAKLLERENGAGADSVAENNEKAESVATFHNPSNVGVVVNGDLSGQDSEEDQKTTSMFRVENDKVSTNSKVDWSDGQQSYENVEKETVDVYTTTTKDNNLSGEDTHQARRE